MLTLPMLSMVIFLYKGMNKNINLSKDTLLNGIGIHFKNKTN